MGNPENGAPAASVEKEPEGVNTTVGILPLWYKGPQRSVDIRMLSLGSCGSIDGAGPKAERKNPYLVNTNSFK